MGHGMHSPPSSLGENVFAVGGSEIFIFVVWGFIFLGVWVHVILK